MDKTMTPESNTDRLSTEVSGRLHKLVMFFVGQHIKSKRTDNTGQIKSFCEDTLVATVYRTNPDGSRRSDIWYGPQGGHGVPANIWVTQLEGWEPRTPMCDNLTQ
jgi:murein tripeptide amidase MpaA